MIRKWHVPQMEGDVLADEGSMGQVRDFETMPLRDDNPSHVELLGFDDVVAAVGSTVTRPDLDPITVSVNAPWGGGKTTVLRLLQKQLVSMERPAPVRICVGHPH
jgi:hypothetical protein